MFESIRAVFRFHESFASTKTRTCLRLARQLQECDISCENWDNLRRHNNGKHNHICAKSNTTKYVESAYSHLKNIFDSIAFSKQPSLQMFFRQKLVERKELSLGGSELFRKQTWPSALLLLLLLATSLARQLNFFPSKIMTFKVVRNKGENILRWKMKIMHGPRASGPGVHGSRAKADPTGANWIQRWLSLRPQAFPARSMFTPQISPLPP